MPRPSDQVTDEKLDPETAILRQVTGSSSEPGDEAEVDTSGSSCWIQLLCEYTELLSEPPGLEFTPYGTTKLWLGSPQNGPPAQN